MRGMLTREVQFAALAHLGEEITRTELRLMPYIQFLMVNTQKVEPNKITSIERGILQKWREAGYIEGGAGGLRISKDFWDAIHEILWVGYVACDEALTTVEGKEVA
jgi:hypothetical protein